MHTCCTPHPLQHPLWRICLSRPQLLPSWQRGPDYQVLETGLHCREDSMQQCRSAKAHELGAAQTVCTAA